jgi:hypothetical protein
MSFVLNRNVKEAKVINYYGGSINVTLENNKTINLGSISNNNSIEMNNLKKVYLIKIGQQNNNDKNIFLVAATKKFNETQVMKENVEKNPKNIMTNANANYNLLSQNKSKNPIINNNEEEELIPYRNVNKNFVETEEINFGNSSRESNERIKMSEKRKIREQSLNTALKTISKKPTRNARKSLSQLETEIASFKKKNINSEKFKNFYQGLDNKIKKVRNNITSRSS